MQIVDCGTNIFGLGTCAYYFPKCIDAVGLYTIIYMYL